MFIINSAVNFKWPGINFFSKPSLQPNPNRLKKALSHISLLNVAGCIIPPNGKCATSELLSCWINQWRLVAPSRSLMHNFSSFPSRKVIDSQHKCAGVVFHLYFLFPLTKPLHARLHTIVQGGTHALSARGLPHTHTHTQQPIHLLLVFTLCNASIVYLPVFALSLIFYSGGACYTQVCR